LVIKIQLPHLHGENFVFEIWFWLLLNYGQGGLGPSRRGHLTPYNNWILVAKKINNNNNNIFFEVMETSIKFSNHILMFQICIYFNATKIWSSYGSRTHIYLVTLVPQNYLTKGISIAVGLKILPLHKNYYFDLIDPMLILNQCDVGLNQNRCNMTRPMLITICPL